MKLLLALALCALFSASLQAPNVESNYPTDEYGVQPNKDAWKDRPAFCKQYDCPIYKVENKTEKFELRVYNQARWISVEKDGFFISRLLTAAFTPIFNFGYEGENSEQKRFPLAVPFIARFRDVDASWLYIEGLSYAPYSFGTLPEPVDPSVTFKNWPGKLRVYVKVFHGQVISMWQVRQQRDKLFWELDRSHLKYVKNSVSLATYSHSNYLTWGKRHNEIWVRAM